MGLTDHLKQHTYHPVIPSQLQFGRALVLDMDAPCWHEVDIFSPKALWDQTRKLMLEEGADIALGRYGEDRAHIYKRSDIFKNNTDLRSIHLGIDLMTPPGTEVYLPLAGRVHSLADNESFGDYGPTVIVEHKIADYTFFTMYGHLSRQSLRLIETNLKLEAGQTLGAVGAMEENGRWPPHLHFQLITDMLGYEGGFPGVAAPAEKADYLALYPDPNLILQIPVLDRGKTYAGS